MSVDSWVMHFDGYRAADEGRREALCALGNGAFATRGAAPESVADAVHYPGTYASGLFNRLASTVEGRVVHHESMVNLPNWLPLAFRPDGGAWLDLDQMQVLDYDLRLDVRQGVLTRRFRVVDRDGRRTAVAERRFVHMANPRLAALCQQITPENWSGKLEVRSGIDGLVVNGNVADERTLEGRHLRTVDCGEHGADVIWLEAETTQSHVRVAQAVRTRVDMRGKEGPRLLQRGPDRVNHLYSITATTGTPVTVEKVVALSTSLDHAISAPLDAALAELRDAGDFDELLPAHVMAWSHLWGQCGIDVAADDPETSRALTLHGFHVLQTLSPHIADRDVGVPARGLHGEGYRGHVFWDELFVFPYLNLRKPDLTRALLLYRYRRLSAARRLARQEGRRGATYPWQSGSDGTEETPAEFYNPRSNRWMADNSRRERHVSLAVAYNIWQYYQVTADVRFLADHGAEMLIEIARYWADLASFDATDRRFHIRGVMGPDEFHDGYPDRPGMGIDDNAYTNVLVSWLLRRARDTYGILGDHHCGELWERLALTDDELGTWDDISRHLAIVFLANGVISQFAGYDQLAELDWDAYRRRYDNMQRLDLILEAEGDSPNRYKCSKQADALMLLYLFSSEELTDLLGHLGYTLDPATIPRAVDYYLSRSSNGSTLSRVAHSWVLARSDRQRSLGVFREALTSDIGDIQAGTTREGIHLGAMAGTVDLVQRCYTGIEARDDALWFNPRLPEGLGKLSFAVTYRGHWIDIELTTDRLLVSSRPCAAEPVTLGLHGDLVALGAGKTAELMLRPPPDDPGRLRSSTPGRA